MRFELKKNGMFILVGILLCFTVLADNRFPGMPNPQMTPGSLCQDSKERRYPEGIRYCRRAVDKLKKKAIIDLYDSRFGYKIASMDRNLFKIDHYIPLCMGGSNESDNLWPQHISLWKQTDSIEFDLCERMRNGLLSQAEAVELIKKAKTEAAGNCLAALRSIN